MTDTQIIHQFAEQNLLVEKYLLQELSGADLEDFERHMFECEICFEQVKIGQAFTQGVAAGDLSRPSPRKNLADGVKQFFFGGKNRKARP